MGKTNKHRKETSWCDDAGDILFYNCDFFKNSIENSSASLIICDPPWEVITDAQAWDRSIDFYKMATEFDRILAPNGQLVFFSNLNLAIKIVICLSYFFDLRYNFVWQKLGGQPVNGTRPISDHELIPVFVKKGVKRSDLTFNWTEVAVKGKPYEKKFDTKNPTRRNSKSYTTQNKNGLRYPRSIIVGPSKPNMTKYERTSHPCQKPISIISYLVKLLSNEGDIILDPFAGSATTLIAAHMLKRKAIGFELKSEYFEEARERMIAEQSNPQMNCYV